MPRPTNLRDIIEPQANAQLSHLNPCGDGWVDEIGRHSWWRVRCYVPMMAAAGLRFSDIAQRDVLDAAVAEVPNEWTQFYQPPQGDAANWDRLSTDRIHEVVHGRSRKKTSAKNGVNAKSIGVSFPKAALSILALEIAARRSGVDIYEHVRICPSIYVINGFDKTVWRAANRETKREAQRASGQRSWTGIELLAEKGRPVTYSFAKSLENHFAGFDGVGDVAIKDELHRVSASSKPNHGEKIRCSLR